MIELLGLGPDLFAGSYIAPDATGQPSVYCRPSHRFLVESLGTHQLSAEHCWMIGDTPSDWRAGLATGVYACAVRSDLTSLESERIRHDLKVPVFDNLDLAFAHIEALLAV